MEPKASLLREDARALAHALLADSNSKLPEDVRTALSYWKSCEIAAERAAAQLVLCASALGVRAGPR